jgi:hypothetical protein
MAQSLEARVLPVDDVSRSGRNDMFRLMQRHYANVKKEIFDRDLAKKQWIIQVRSLATGELCGFSTQAVVDAAVEGKPIKALFSGDTIIDPDFWGDSSLLLAGGKLCLSLIDTFPNSELYWFLISAGYKTYRFLPVFFQEYYPRYDRPTPAAMLQAIDALSSQLFPGRYDGAGIIRADANQYRLRGGVADITPERLQDPNIRFFAERNPGHVVGDELCCLARLTRENFTAAANRILASEKNRRAASHVDSEPSVQA